MEPDIAEYDSLDEVLCVLDGYERLEVVAELESDGVWNERLHDHE